MLRQHTVASNSSSLASLLQKGSPQSTEETGSVIKLRHKLKELRNIDCSYSLFR